MFLSAVFRHDFQFFNTQRLSELYEKEVRYLMVGDAIDLTSFNSALSSCAFRGTCASYLLGCLSQFQQAHQKNQLKDTIEVDEPEGTLSQLLPVLSSFCFLCHFTNH